MIYWCARTDVGEDCRLRLGTNCMVDLSMKYLVEMAKGIPRWEEIDESEIIEWLEADDAELELTDQEIVEAVIRPESEGDDRYLVVHDTDTKRVTADDGFKALEAGADLPFCRPTTNLCGVVVGGGGCVDGFN